MSQSRPPQAADAGTALREAGVPPVAAADLAELALESLRAYRQKLADEEDRVSYWRRLVHARLDLLRAQSTEGPLSLDALARALGDTGSGRTRTALVRVRAAEALPELPVLEEMWVTEVDPDDAEAVDRAMERLATAERQLTSYRSALHQRIDEATAELIERYRKDPASALGALRRGGGSTPRRPAR